MATEMMLPKLGVSMAEGTIVEWLVDDGDLVAEGDPVYRLETDKVESDVESPCAGAIRLLVEPGLYDVGTKVAEITTTVDIESISQ